jgi:hypothetical protein
VLMDHALRGRSGEWRLTGEHLIEDARECINVGAGVERLLAGDLFGTHVRRRPDRYAGCGQPFAARNIDRVSDSEIGNDGVTTLE